MSDAYYTIKVTNLVTGAVFEHRRVPQEHVEAIKLNPNLMVEIVEIDLSR